MTVKENLEMGAFVERNKHKIRDAMDFVFNFFPRLAERQKQMAGTMSGGEQQMLNMENYLSVYDTVVSSARSRQESRGAHFRSDFPDRNDAEFLCNFTVTHHGGAPNPIPSPSTVSGLQA